MRPVATVAQIREAEKQCFEAHPGIDLMARAADAVARRALEMAGLRGRILVVVGPGNNGGDGLFAAAELARAGCRVAVCFTSQRRHEAGAAAARSAGCLICHTDELLEQLTQTDLVIDAVLGIDGRPGLVGTAAECAAACARADVPVLSVDLPSGLAADSSGADDLVSDEPNASTGDVVAGPAPSFRANRTVTFGGLKLCHVAAPARERCGIVELVPLGLTLSGVELWAADHDDVVARWPFPDWTSDKYSRGVVGLDTGSQRYPGAGVLSTMGALYSGAGMIRYCGPARPAELVAAAMPSVTFGAGQVQAWVLGSGWGRSGDDARAADALAARLAEGVPAVIDADALAVLPDQVPQACVLTPHAGELARLLSMSRAEVEADPIGAVRSAARHFDAVVLLKGATQYVAEPDGRVTIAVPGSAWSAQAGSGDTLAGICGTLLAAGLSARWAAVLAASIQAMTAVAHPGPYPADVMARQLARTIGGLRREQGSD